MADRPAAPPHRTNRVAPAGSPAGDLPVPWTVSPDRALPPHACPPPHGNRRAVPRVPRTRTPYRRTVPHAQVPAVCLTDQPWPVCSRVPRTPAAPSPRRYGVPPPWKTGCAAVPPSPGCVVLPYPPQLRPGRSCSPPTAPVPHDAAIRRNAVTASESERDPGCVGRCRSGAGGFPGGSVLPYCRQGPLASRPAVCPTARLCHALPRVPLHVPASSPRTPDRPDRPDRSDRRTARSAPIESTSSVLNRKLKRNLLKSGIL